MCGIVGAATRREVADILIEGLKRLEYRGYDSAGLAVVNANDSISCVKRLGKVAVLADSVHEGDLHGATGIAHTRWATHGKPSEENAHPHVSHDEIALVHNGIIENHEALRAELEEKGYTFDSQTDTEVIVHLVHLHMQEGMGLHEAVLATVPKLEGAFGLAVLCKNEPHRIFAARSGSPLVIGLGIGENFLASDQLALRQVTDRFIYLEEGDFAEITPDSVSILDSSGAPVERSSIQITEKAEAAEKGVYRHYMLKEIFEQEKVIQSTLTGRISDTSVLEASFGAGASEIFDRIRHVQIIACGTSYHAGMVARYWMEALAGYRCTIEVASEYRYRKSVTRPGTLFVTISQSGETADTLAALRNAKEAGFEASLAIVNAPESSLVRESDLVLMTQAGPEIGVASTKAFTTQLTALLLLTIVLGRRQGLSNEREAELVKDLHNLPALVGQTLELDRNIRKISEHFAEKHHALFLGRGVQYPVAMEGALKLKEISYIHAEAYPAGELKHGPLALVDSDMPVIAVAPNDELLEKLKSNLEEVHARGGQLFVFADVEAGFSRENDEILIDVPTVSDVLAPIIYTIPLQLLSYHVAVLKGTDVDQPRNLAKSVTVE
ncbi:MAG: glutamine--fructose-6-phosphate transaminase (isomerizing) [Pseudomonadales bacterium]